MGLLFILIKKIEIRLQFAYVTPRLFVEKQDLKLSTFVEKKDLKLSTFVEKKDLKLPTFC